MHPAIKKLALVRREGPWIPRPLRPGHAARSVFARRWVGGLLVMMVCVPAALAQTALDERVMRIGKKMLCLCGCNQILVECNHLNCSFSEAAKATLRKAAATDDSDDMAVQVMIQQYGTRILAAPPAQGFNVTAWVTPFVALLGGAMVIAFVLRRWWRRRSASEPAAPITLDPAWRERVRREIDAELEGG